MHLLTGQESGAQRLTNAPKTKQQLSEPDVNVGRPHKFFMNHIKFFKSPPEMLAWPELSLKCIFLRARLAGEAGISRAAGGPGPSELSGALACTA